MNKEHLLFHLNEAREELEQTIRACESDTDYSEAELFVAMQHLYHHINTAWNARGLNRDRIAQATDQDFNNWGAFPTDLEPLAL